MHRFLFQIRKLVGEMSQIESSWIIAAVIGLFILIGYAAHLAEKARKARLAALADFCDRNGFIFSPEGRLRTSQESFLWMKYDVHTDPIVETFSFHSLFTQGHSKKAAPVMSKSDGNMEWMLFDYQYSVTTSNGKTTTTTRYPHSVVVARVPYDLPLMTLTPQNVFHSIGKVFGANELETESVEFNKKFFVDTQDHRRATEILVPELLEFLIQLGGRYWHWNGPFLISYVSGTVSAADYERMWNEAKQIISLVPNFYKIDNQ